MSPPTPGSKTAIPPKLGLIPPLTFIPLTAQAGLMRPLTEWALSSALTQCAAWRAAGRELVVSVNVPPVD